MLWTNILRTMRSSAGRFVSIVCLVALGTFALVGLQATAPDMRATLTDYTTSYGFCDLVVMGDLGLDEDDVADLEALDGVAVLELGYLVDVTIEGTTDSVRVQSAPELLSCYELVEGRMPTATDEVALATALQGDYELGDTISLVEDTGSEVLVCHELTVVGFVNSSEILGSSSMGNTTVGTGTLTAFAVVVAEAFDVDYYMCARIQFEDTAELDPTSQEYLDLVAAHKVEVESALEGASERRYATVCAQYEEAIAEGEDELADAQAELDEAAAELADAASELDEAATELADAEAELADGSDELDEAWAELESALAELEDAESTTSAAKSELLAAMAELEDAKDELDDAADELDDAAAQIAEAEAQIAEAEDELADAQAQVDAYYEGLAEYEEGLAEYEEALAELEATQAELEAQADEIDELEELVEELQDELASGDLTDEEAEALEAELEGYLQTVAAYYLALAQCELTQTALEQAAEELAEAKATLDASADAVAEAEEAIAEGTAELEAARAELAEAQAAYDEGLAEYEAGYAEWYAGTLELAAAATELAAAESELASGWTSYQDGLDSYDEGLTEYQDGQDEYDDGVTAYEEGVSEYEEGVSAYDEALAEYEEALDEAEQAIADAEAELDDAREALAELDEPVYSVMNHREFYGSNGYTMYVAIFEMVDSVAAIFPTFFYLVAALVISSTMTRMVDEERACAGTLKALGYTDLDVLKKFVFYGATAALLGAAVGIASGHVILPYLLNQAFASSFTLPDLELLFYPGVTVLAVALSLAVTLVPTVVVALRTSMERPADLMRPKAPASGSKILLERVRPVWDRLSFTYKVTARNLFRYKTRALMTILGVSGSVGLIFFGFAVQNSIGGISERQFGTILGYDLIVAVDDDADADETDELLASLDSGYSVGYAGVAYQSVSCVAGSKNDSQSIYLFVPTEGSSLDGYITLYDADTGAVLDLPDEGVIISKRLSTLTGVGVGEYLTFTDEGGTERTVLVAGVCEMYVEHFMFMSAAYHEEVFGEKAADNAYLVDLTDEAEEAMEVVSAELLALDAVTGVVSNASSLNLVDTIVLSMNIIMIILITVSILLACVIVYNLVTINVAERIRELSTIKVLGFYNREVTMYIYRETIALSVLGVPIGWLMGWALQQYLINAVPPDRVMFDPATGVLPFVISTAVLAAVVAVMGWVVYRQLRDVDMLEALKSNE